MKRLKQISSLLVLVAIIGCATNRLVYNTLAGVDATTTQSVLSYYELVAKKQVSTRGVQGVAKAYDTYKTVFGTAVAVAQFNTNAPASTSVIAAASEVSSAIIQAKGLK